MLKQNMIQRGTQAADLGVMIGRCSPNSQRERPDRHPTNVGCSFFFRYTNDELKDHTNQRRKHKNVLGKTTNLHYTTILGATLHKEDIGK